MQTRFQWMLVHPAAIIAQGAGSGLLHPASGTWGTLVGWVLFVFLSQVLTPMTWIIFLAVTFPIGVWACHVTGKQLGVHDDSSIVFDEMWAIWLVLLFVMPAPFWQQVVAFGQVARHQLEGLRVDDRVAQVDALLAQAFRQRLAQRRFGDKTEGNQQLADWLVALHLLQQRDAQLVFRKDTFGNQDLAERAVLEGGRAHGRYGCRSGCNSPRRCKTLSRAKPDGRFADASKASL